MSVTSDRVWKVGTLLSLCLLLHYIINLEVTKVDLTVSSRHPLQLENRREDLPHQTSIRNHTVEGVKPVVVERAKPLVVERAKPLVVEGEEPLVVESVEPFLFEQRREHLREACANISEEEPIRNKEFLINSEYKLAWCNIFKSASTTWLHKFLALKGFTEQDVKRYRKKVITFVRRNDIYPRPSKLELEKVLQDQDFSSFIIVREPFERLLSSYCDKIENRGDSFYESLRCRMSPTCRPSFKDFVQYILKQYSLGEQLDEHWTPYFSFCSPCQVVYNYILHFESLSQDERILFEEKPSLRSKLKSADKNASNRKYERLVPKYYETLTKRQMEALIDMFRHDFEIFQYDYLKYLDYV